MAERYVLRLSADDLTGSSERDGAGEAREENESRGTFLADDRVFADGVGESVVSVGEGSARRGAGEAIGAG